MPGGEIQIDLGIDRQIGRQRNLLLRGNDGHRAFEAGRPAGREQLLGIGAGAWRTGHRELDVQTVVAGARFAFIAAARGMHLGRIQQLRGRRGGLCRGIGHEGLLLSLAVNHPR